MLGVPAHLARVVAEETVQPLAQRAEVAARTLRLLACQRKHRLAGAVDRCVQSAEKYNICNAAAPPSGKLN